MSRKLLAGTVLVGAAILAAVFGLNAPKPLYARSVSEFLARPLREQRVRLQGLLVHGSLCQSRAACEYQFRLKGGGWSARSDAGPLSAERELSVRYPSCILPDTLRDSPGVDTQITVEGELCASCHRFEASQLLIKCPGKYWLKAPPGPDSGAVIAPPTPVCSAN